MQGLLKAYLHEHNFMTDDQSTHKNPVIQQKHLHKAIVDVLEGVNEGMITGFARFDLAICFDSIDHDILMVTLQSMVSKTMYFHGLSLTFPVGHIL